MRNRAEYREVNEAIERGLPVRASDVRRWIGTVKTLAARAAEYGDEEAEKKYRERLAGYEKRLAEKKRKPADVLREIEECEMLASALRSANPAASARYEGRAEELRRFLSSGVWL